MIRVDSIKIKPTANIDPISVFCSKYKISKRDIKEFKILKKSVDARKKDNIYYLFSFAVKLNDKSEQKLIKCNKNISFYKENTLYSNLKKVKNHTGKTVIVGEGPAGLFAGYLLALAGLNPIIVEQGKDVDARFADVLNLWNDLKLNEYSNVQFGEGGAGTFSDGKLNTGVKDKEGRNDFVLKTFVKFGAPECITYDAKPHIGSDILRDVIKEMRNEIIRLGGEVRFNTKFIDFKEENKVLKSIKILDLQKDVSSEIECDNCILALGHSSRDTMQMLYDKSINMEAKPFAMGFRVIHSQEFINKAQYGSDYENLYEGLPVSPYKVTARDRNERGVYSFCMCPGGYVVNASSEKGRLCVNGMSNSGRDSDYANSAIIVQISPQDYDSNHPLSGMKMQREIESKAYNLCNGLIPVQNYEDFVKDEESKESTIDPSKAILGKWCYTNLSSVFPDYLKIGIIDGIDKFNKDIDGFATSNPLLCGVETRTSSPVKIIRDESLCCDIKGLYPCGEGAGYAGGIMSAAMDGLKVAEQIIKASEA